MEQTPRRSLLTLVSIVWSTNCPSWLYAIKCAIIFVVFSYQFGADLELVAWIASGTWLVAGMLRRFAQRFGETFVDLEGALFWILPFIFVTARTMGFLERLFSLDLTSTNAFSFGLLIAIALAFVVSRLLRRATKPKQ